MEIRNYYQLISIPEKQLISKIEFAKYVSNGDLIHYEIQINFKCLP